MISSSSLDTVHSELTPEEIAKAEQYLTDTREALVETVAGLSAPQWDFKPAPDRWSIAETVEHVAIIEDRVHFVIAKMSEAPPPPPDWEPTKVDDAIMIEVPNRSTKFEAPPPVRPTNRWSGAEALKHFVESREQTIQLLSVSSLRGHIIQHPIGGPWEGYHWLLAAGAHSARHTKQIIEVKTDPEYPVGSETSASGVR